MIVAQMILSALLLALALYAARRYHLETLADRREKEARRHG